MREQDSDPSEKEVSSKFNFFKYFDTDLSFRHIKNSFIKKKRKHF